MKRNRSGVLNSEDVQLPASLDSEKHVNGVQSASNRQIDSIPLPESPAVPATGIAYKAAAVNGDARAAKSGAPVLPAAVAAQAKLQGAQATVSTPVEQKKPKKRGPEMSNRKGYLRSAGFWIRKAHTEWADTDLTPGRAMAIAGLLRTGAAILDGATSEKELAEADELHKLMLEVKARKDGRIGVA